MAVENVGSYPEVNEQLTEKAFKLLNTLEVRWEGRDVTAIAGDLCEKIVPLFSSKASELPSRSSVDLSKMKVEVVKLAELIAQELEAFEESDRLFYYDPISGAYQVLLAAQKHHKHKKRKWWVIGGIVLVVAAAIVITVATGGGAGPAAASGAASAVGGLAATDPGRKEEDKKKDNKNASPPPNDPPPPKPVATTSATPSQPTVTQPPQTPVNQTLQTKPNIPSGGAQIPHQAQAVTKSQTTSAANVPPVVKHAEAAKTAPPQPTVQQAQQKQESVPMSKTQSLTGQSGNNPPTEIHQNMTQTAPSNSANAKEANFTVESYAKHIASETAHVVWRQMGQAKIEANNLGNKLGEVVNKVLPGALQTNNLDEVKEKIDQGHKAIDKTLGTELASRYDTNAPPSKITTLELPFPGVSILTRASQAGRIAKVAEVANGLKTTAIAEEVNIASRATQVIEKSAVEARVGSAAGQVLKEEAKVVGHQKQVAVQAEKLVTKNEGVAKAPHGITTKEAPQVAKPAEIKAVSAIIKEHAAPIRVQSNGVWEIEGKNIKRFNPKTEMAKNKLNHIFENSEHNLNKIGLTPENAIEKITQKVINADIAGEIPINKPFKVLVKLNEHSLEVRGIVIDGELRIGTVFIPE